MAITWADVWRSLSSWGSESLVGRSISSSSSTVVVSAVGVEKRRVGLRGEMSDAAAAEDLA